MKRIPSAAALLFAVSIGFSQTPAKERDTLQALLDEVHQLRQDIEGMTVASQRVQIALYQLQMQDSAVARAALRVDNARTKCSGAEGNRQHMAEEIRSAESAIASGTTSEAETKALKARVPGLKSELEIMTAEAQACQAAEAEASSQLRNDQAKLMELQDRIARLDKALERLGGAAK
jgi:chromosome segregation ATPase